MSDKIKKTKMSTKTSDTKVKKPRMDKKSTTTDEIEKDIKADVKNMENLVNKSSEKLEKKIRSSRDVFFGLINFLGMSYVAILTLFLIQFVLYEIWHIEIIKTPSVLLQQKIGLGFFAFGNIIYRIRSISRELITKKMIICVLSESLIFIIAAGVLMFEAMDVKIYIPKWI